MVLEIKKLEIFLLVQLGSSNALETLLLATIEAAAKYSSKFKLNSEKETSFTFYLQALVKIFFGWKTYLFPDNEKYKSQLRILNIMHKF